MKTLSPLSAVSPKHKGVVSMTVPDPVRVRRLLVIKFGGLGDLLLSLRALQAIREQYPLAQITLLTMAPFAELAKTTGIVNRVWVDSRPRIGKLHQLVQFRQRLISANFQLVIDLQRSDRTAMYFHMLLSHQPFWSGHVFGCHYRLSRSELRRYHPLDRDIRQLRQLGITKIPNIPADWLELTTGLKKLVQKKNSILLVPDIAIRISHGDEKNLGVSHGQRRGYSHQHEYHNTDIVDYYSYIAHRALRKRKQVYVLGSAKNDYIACEISKKMPKVVNLTGKFNLLELLLMADSAKLVVGHDTGITHILAACGCETVILPRQDTQMRYQAAMMSNIKTLKQDEVSRINIDEMLNFRITIQ